MPAIRNIAVVALRRGDEVLLMSGFDRVKQRTFYRAPGGGIEYGETAAAAARREILEELEIEIDELRQLGILENLFVQDGTAGHEVVFVFEADWPEGIPTTPTFEAREDDGTPFTCQWLPIAALHDNAGFEGEVVPPGFLGLLGRAHRRPLQRRGKSGSGIGDPRPTYAQSTGVAAPGRSRLDRSPPRQRFGR